MSHPFDKFLHCLICWKDAGSYGSATKKNRHFSSPLRRLYDPKRRFLKERVQVKKKQGKNLKKPLRDEFLGIFMQSMSENQLMFGNAADVRHAQCPPEGMKCGLPQSRSNAALHQVFHISWDGFSSWEQFRSWDIDCHSPWVLIMSYWVFIMIWFSVPECPD